MICFDRRQLLIAALIVAGVGFAPPSASAAEATKKSAPPPPGNDAKPEDIVKNLYDRYAAEKYDYMEDALRPRYFTKATDALLKKVFDKSTADNEPGIDYEPLIDGQDGEVKALAIVVTSSSPVKATVEARFNSYEEKVVVAFDFLLEKTAWKIDDIRSKQGTSLKSVAKEYLQ